MEIVYLFSSPGGDVPVDDKTLKGPFRVAPFSDHPFMTLGDYFDAIRDFVLRDGGRSLGEVLPGTGDRGVSGVDRILIRYEKYGTLYQIASAEVFAGGKRMKFAVSAALLPEAKEILDREFEVLKGLNEEFPYPFLPRVYFRDRVRVEKAGEVETIVMTLSGWFEGYHEWHFSVESGRVTGLVIWDLEGGYRQASGQEAREIIRQVSRILTLYYDTETCRQIFPWHHGAGDFVVRPEGGGVDVRLVSVRGYEPVPFLKDQEKNPILGIVSFFLTLTIKIRLDKLEGMGEPVWAGPDLLHPLAEGFFQALREKESKGDYHLGRADDLLRILRAMDSNTIRKRLSDQMVFYREQDPVDAALVDKHLDDHAEEVYRTLQEFRG